MNISGEYNSYGNQMVFVFLFDFYSNDCFCFLPFLMGAVVSLLGTIRTVPSECKTLKRFIALKTCVVRYKQP